MEQLRTKMFGIVFHALFSSSHWCDWFFSRVFTLIWLLVFVALKEISFPASSREKSYSARQHGVTHFCCCHSVLYTIKHLIMEVNWLSTPLTKYYLPLNNVCWANGKQTAVTTLEKRRKCFNYFKANDIIKKNEILHQWMSMKRWNSSTSKTHQKGTF